MSSFNDQMLEYLRTYNSEKKEEGFIPTLDLLIEELEKQNETYNDAHNMTQSND